MSTVDFRPWRKATKQPKFVRPFSHVNSVTLYVDTSVVEALSCELWEMHDTGAKVTALVHYRNQNWQESLLLDDGVSSASSALIR